MSNADFEVLPGFNRADLLFLAESLEGVLGEGRRTDVETTRKAAAFIRAYIAQPVPRMAVVVPHASER